MEKTTMQRGRDALNNVRREINQFFGLKIAGGCAGCSGAGCEACRGSSNNTPSLSLWDSSKPKADNLSDGKSESTSVSLREKKQEKNANSEQFASVARNDGIFLLPTTSFVSPSESIAMLPLQSTINFIRPLTTTLNYSFISKMASECLSGPSGFHILRSSYETDSRGICANEEQPSLRDTFATIDHTNSNTSNPESRLSNVLFQLRNSICGKPASVEIGAGRGILETYARRNVYAPTLEPAAQFVQKQFEVVIRSGISAESSLEPDFTWSASGNKKHDNLQGKPCVVTGAASYVRTRRDLCNSRPLGREIRLDDLVVPPIRCPEAAQINQIRLQAQCSLAESTHVGLVLSSIPRGSEMDLIRASSVQINGYTYMEILTTPWLRRLYGHIFGIGIDETVAPLTKIRKETKPGSKVETTKPVSSKKLVSFKSQNPGSKPKSPLQDSSPKSTKSELELSKAWKKNLTLRLTQLDRIIRKAVNQKTKGASQYKALAKEFKQTSVRIEKLILERMAFLKRERNTALMLAQIKTLNELLKLLKLLRRKRLVLELLMGGKKSKSIRGLLKVLRPLRKLLVVAYDG